MLAWSAPIVRFAFTHMYIAELRRNPAWYSASIAAVIAAVSRTELLGPSDRKPSNTCAPANK
jgi:hypothetical protein